MKRLWICVAALLAGACVAPVVIQVVLFASNLYATGTTIALALPFILGLGMALGSTLGGWLAGGGSALVPVLLIGAILRIVSGLIIEAPMAKRHSNRLAVRVAQAPSPGGD